MFRIPRPYLSLILPILLLTGCGDGDGDPTTPTDTVVDVTVTPSSATVGRVVEVGGLDLTDVDATDVLVRVDEQEALARISASGTLLVGVPVFMDGNALAPLPTEPLDVEVRIDGHVAGFAASALTVTAPPVAPGALDDVAVSLRSIVEDVEAVARVLAPTPSLEDGYATALFGALRELIEGDDPRSLSSQLAELEADELALVEGILAGSGVVDRLEDVATLLGGLSVATADASTPDLRRRATEIDQYDLAARMQLYVMIRDVGQEVIGQTVADWGAFIGPVFGGINLVGAGAGFAAAGTVGTILSVLNFGVNTIALSYLPARIDAFDLIVNEQYVAPGEVADTEIWITASNDPSPITTLDLVDLVLNAIGTPSGAGGVPPGDPRRNALIQTIDYFLGIFRGLLSGYGAQHPGSDLAFDVASIPQWTWRAQVTDTRFASPRSFTPEIIDANGSGILAWRAATNTTGEGRIYAQLENGPEVTSLVQIPGYSYNAGAFGDDVLTSETQTVNVAAPLFLLTSMDTAISAGGTNGLEARVGTVGATGDTLYLQGVSIACSAEGGSVSPASGTTGADGRFDTFVSLDTGSTGVVVDVVATDAVGQSVSSTVGATSEEQLVVDISLPDRVPADEDVSVTVTVQLLTPQGLVPAEGAQLSVYGENGSDVEDGDTVVGASGVFTTTARIDPDENELVIGAEARYATLEDVEVEERALREDSIEIVSITALDYAEVFATWTPVDGEPNERFVEEFDIEEFTEIVASITSTTAAVGSGSRDGMLVEGASDASMDVTLDRDGSGLFESVRLQGSTSTSLSLTNPSDRPYQVQSEAVIELSVEIEVWGTPATFTFSGSSSTEIVDVEIEGRSEVGDLVDCYSETGACSSFSESGALPVGEYDVDITLVDDARFDSADFFPAAGSIDESGSFDLEFSARHGGN